MLGYYLDLALRSFRRSKALTALMVLAIALGIGASMTTLTVFHVLSGDPLPGKSDRLFFVQLDSVIGEAAVPGAEPEPQLTRFDAETLLREHRADKQAMMTRGEVSVQSEQAGVKPFFVTSRYTSVGFFSMFDVPFLFGGAWDEKDDADGARLAVITRALNDKVFAGANSVGRRLRIGDNDVRVAGVLDTWRPVPHFYDLTTGRYSDIEQVFMPFSTAMALKLPVSGSTRCYGKDNTPDVRAVNAPCSWIQFWAQLDSHDKAASYRDYLVHYSDQQRAAGRFEHPTNIRLRKLMDWLDFNKVVPSDVRLQVWLAFGFLLVCLVNTVGLLLAKCLKRSAEIGVRRALGAQRASIFAQFLVEAGAIGIAGGTLGLMLALLGLWGVRHNPSRYAQLAQLDGAMLATTFAIAIGASLVAGLLPAWRACQVTPALQLKSQ